MLDVITVALIKKYAQGSGGAVTPEEIEEAVTKYLDEHPVQPTPIDDTLSIGGEAADAKATGDAVAKAIKYVKLSDDGCAIEFYKEEPESGVSADTTIDFPNIDTSDFMKLAAYALENDIAIFDSKGQVVDSNTKISDLAAMTYIGDIPKGYESATIVDFVIDYMLENGYDDTELRKRIAEAEEEIGVLNGDDTTEGSVAKAISDVRSELIKAIDTAVANAGNLKIEIVATLPSVEEADELTIYLLAKDTSEGDTVYNEYMVIAGSWELIGDTHVDLTDYATIAYVDSEIADAMSGISAIPTSDIEKMFD